MASDTTQLQEPATPAPVFAYRALRSIFFNSPDSSPEKENVPFIRRSQSPNKAQKGPCESSKPLEQKFDVLMSPTKSILRMPGAPTPRRAMLQDVTVTFKDVRKSVSPEVLRNGSTMGKKPPQPEFRPQQPREEQSKPGLHPRRNSGEQKRGSKAVKQDSKNDIARGKLAVLSVDERATEFDEYMRNTEKEMRKLIRYGQKMKEYARQQDVENTKLRGMIEEVQAENKRLRRAEEQRQQVEQRRKEQVVAVPERKKEPAKPSQPERETYTGQPSSVDLLHRKPSTKLVGARAHEMIQSARMDGAAKSLDKPPNNLMSSCDTQWEQLTIKPLPVSEDPKVDVFRASKDFQVTNDDSVKFGTTRLPPDRAAAARERLRRKAESRLTSVEMNESNVDWAGL